MFSLSDSIQISSFNTPLDVRTRVADLSKLTDGSIQMPYVGLIVWVTNEEKAYVVTGITGTLITSYKPIGDDTAITFAYTVGTTKSSELSEAIGANKIITIGNYIASVEMVGTGSSAYYIVSYTDKDGVFHQITHTSQADSTGSETTKEFVEISGNLSATSNIANAGFKNYQGDKVFDIGDVDTNGTLYNKIKNAVHVDVDTNNDTFPKTFAVKNIKGDTIGSIALSIAASGAAVLTFADNVNGSFVATLPNLRYDSDNQMLKMVDAEENETNLIKLSNLQIKTVFDYSTYGGNAPTSVDKNAYAVGDLALVEKQDTTTTPATVSYKLAVVQSVTAGSPKDTIQWQDIGSINNVSLNAKDITFTSNSGLTATDVQHALDEVNLIGDGSSESDLDIADTGGNVLARFADGHFQTKNFNSSEQVSLNQKFVETIDTSSTADLELCDNIGNVLVQFSNGHIKTKYFNSQNVNAKRSIHALFIGNSVNQDHITYLPWLLKNTYGDDLDFHIYVFYIGGYTIKQYVESVITGTKKAEIFSTAINTASWTNENNSVSLANALARDTFDIISVQGYFGPRTTEDITEMPTLVKWISDTYGKPFKLGYMMHQTYTSGNDGTNKIPDIINGVKYAIKSNPVSILFPCGFTTEEAKTFLSESVLTADGIHNQEGLPCVMGAYTVMEKLTNLLGLPSKVLGNTLRVTSSIYSSLNIPGSNGTLQTNTDTEWYNGQMAAIQAVKYGDALENICKEEMYNNIIQPTNS